MQTQKAPRASVHWNLHKNLYAIKYPGKPVVYAEQVYMTDCVFHIDKRLRALFDERNSRRTVHALIKGTVVDFRKRNLRGEAVSCNPFLYQTFVRKSDGAEALTATAIMLHSDKRIEAVGVVTA